MQETLKVGDTIYIVYENGYQKEETGQREITKISKNGNFFIKADKENEPDLKCVLSKNKLRIGYQDSKVGNKPSIYMSKESYETEYKWKNFCSNIIFANLNEEAMNKILDIYEKEMKK